MDGMRSELVFALSEAAGTDVTVDDLKPSPVADIGCPIAFGLAKKNGEDPAKIAEKIAAAIMGCQYVVKAETQGGYINITVDRNKVLKDLLSPEKPAKARPGKVILEHTSVNPTGPIHVGRIRNTIIGDSLARILRHVGHDVQTRYYVNDVGRQVALISLGFEKGLEPDPTLRQRYSKYSQRPDYEMLFTYVVANALAEEDEKFRDEVADFMLRAEASEGDSLAKVTDTAKKGLKGQMEAFTRLGVSFDAFDYESAGLADGSVEEVLKKARASKLYKKTEVGEGLDLAPYGLEKRSGLTVLARADGTSVYLCRDIAYHLKKAGMGERLINVLGEDHKLQAKELSTILDEVFDWQRAIDVVHFSFVSFQGEKFSTRRGDIATVDDLFDDAVAKAGVEVEKRGIGDANTAEMVGIGAVKFHIVKTTPTKQINFSFEDALNFDGETAPYIQYAHARSARLLEKAGAELAAIKGYDTDITEDAEWELILKLSDFLGACEQAAKMLRPDIVASYLIELVQDYGRFYMGCPVMDSPKPIKDRRLLLVAKAKKTVAEGLGLLGIEAPERM